MKTPPTLLLLALLLPWASGCKRHGTESMESANELPAVSVQAVEAVRQENRVVHELPGNTMAKDRATLAARLTAQVVAVHVAMGDEVSEGQLLVELHAPELAARVQQAETALQRAQRNYERERTLLEREASLPETLNELAEQVSIAEGALAEAQALRGYATVIAPFAGVVAHRSVEPGDLASPGLPLLTIEGVGQFQVGLQVPESLPVLVPGAQVGVDIGDSVLQGVVAETSPAMTGASHARRVKIDLPPEYRAGSGRYVKVLWPGAPIEAVVVPRSAIVQVGQLENVFVIEQGRAQLRVVNTAGVSGDNVQIQSGLEGGEIIVANPAPTLRHNQKVQSR